MKVELLNLIITIAGLVLLLISMAIILLGKKVGDERRGQQKIKIGKYIEVSTNSVLTLVLFTASFTLAPLALTYWKPELTAKEYSNVLIYGYVIFEDGTPAENVTIKIIRTYRQKSDTLQAKTGSQGNFTIPIEDAKPKEKYEVVWTKPGYSEITLNFGFNEIPFPVTLKRGEDN